MNIVDSKETLTRMAKHGLLDAIADGLLICDIEGSVMAVNGRVEELSGYPPSELLGKSVELLVPSSLRDQHVRHRAEFFRSGHPTRPMGTGLDTHLVTRSGKTLPVEIALAWLEIDTDELVVTTIRDAGARFRQESSLRAMRAVTGSILEGRPPEDIYALICEEAVELLRASLALVAVRVDSEEGFLVQAAAGDHANGLIGTILNGGFWDDSVARESRTTVESDFGHLRGALNRSLGPAVLIPLPQGLRQGFLFVADEPTCPPFDGESLEALETFASQAGLAFAYGRRLRALAVAGDRDRIARDLHDLVIQRLFGAGLSLQVTSQMFATGDPELSERIREVTDGIDLAIAELRRSIFDLEKKEELGLRDRVLITVEEVLAAHEQSVTVKVHEAISDPPAEKVSHLLATLREALTNTGRHSSASEVDVSVTVGHELVLIVSDDGVGIEATTTAGHGLTNMAARANQLGGEFAVSNSPEGGVQVEWRVPL